MLGRGSTVNERSQFVNRPRPQRTAAELVSLSAQKNGRGITAGCDTQVEVADLDVGHLIRPTPVLYRNRSTA